MPYRSVKQIGPLTATRANVPPSRQDVLFPEVPDRFFARSPS